MYIYMLIKLKLAYSIKIFSYTCLIECIDFMLSFYFYFIYIYVYLYHISLHVYMYISGKPWKFFIGKYITD